MTKRFIFLLVLVLVMIASALTAFAGNEVPSMGLSLVTEDKAPPTITTPGGIAYYEEKNAALFFDPDNASEEEFLVTMSSRRDTRAVDPLRYLLTGSVLRAPGETVDSSEDTVILLLYIKRDGEYVPLATIDAKLHADTNMVESPLLFYTKVMLDNLGNDKVNELRIIAFRRTDADQLELGKTLQITDMKVVARTSVFDRLRIDMGSFQTFLTPATR